MSGGFQRGEQARAAPYRQLHRQLHSQLHGQLRSQLHVCGRKNKPLAPARAGKGSSTRKYFARNCGAARRRALADLRARFGASTVKSDGLHGWSALPLRPVAPERGAAGQGRRPAALQPAVCAASCAAGSRRAGGRARRLGFSRMHPKEDVPQSGDVFNSSTHKPPSPRSLDVRSRLYQRKYVLVQCIVLQLAKNCLHEP
jgi:hypothetical protein